jgi:hypothetical protein
MEHYSYECHIKENTYEQLESKKGRRKVEERSKKGRRKVEERSKKGRRKVEERSKKGRRKVTPKVGSKEEKICFHKTLTQGA